MSDELDWLPPLVLFNDYGGDWHSYLDAIYNYFKQDFVDNKPVFQGRRLGLKRHPLTHGKEATFWHLIQEGAVEEDRTPDFRRCERIRWPRPIIEHDADNSYKGLVESAPGRAAYLFVVRAGELSGDSGRPGKIHSTLDSLSGGATPQTAQIAKGI